MKTPYPGALSGLTSASKEVSLQHSCAVSSPDTVSQVQRTRLGKYIQVMSIANNILQYLRKLFWSYISSWLYLRLLQTARIFFLAFCC